MRKLVAILSLGMTFVASSAAAAVLGPVDTYDALKEAIETAQKGDTVKVEETGKNPDNLIWTINVVTKTFTLTEKGGNANITCSCCASSN